MTTRSRSGLVLIAAAVLTNGIVTRSPAQQASTTPKVVRAVFAEHPAINVVTNIARARQDGHDGVLIVGAGTGGSQSCFVADGGTASCASLKVPGVTGAQLIGSDDLAKGALLVSGLWGEPALALLDHTGDVTWHYDAKYLAMGRFAVLAGDSAQVVIAHAKEGLLFFDAATGERRSQVDLPGALTDVFAVTGSDGRRYLMGLSGQGHVVALATDGKFLRATPPIGVFHAATNAGDRAVLFIAPKDTLYTMDEQLRRGGGWYAPGSADLRISAVDRSDTTNQVVVAMFRGSGRQRDVTGLYVFGPDRRLMSQDASLYPNEGLLILSYDQRSVTFLAGDRGRTWRYTVTW